MKKYILFIVLACGVFPAMSQWTQSFENLGMYRLQISGLADDEQALYVSRLITDCNNVLIARVALDGEGRIFTEGEINFNEIYQKLSVVPNIQVGERYSIKPSKEDYMNTYNNFSITPAKDISAAVPTAIKMSDEYKQSRAHSVMKQLWVEKYPESHKPFMPASNEEDPAVKLQKEKELYNQKNN